MPLFDHRNHELPPNHQPPDIRDGRDYSKMHLWTAEDHANHRRYYNLPEATQEDPIPEFLAKPKKSAKLAESQQ